MRIGVIADVHGNLAALEVALRELSRAGVSRYVCAGDFVGYGPQPNECIDRIAALGAVCVVGNHDLVAIGREGCDRCGPLARTTLQWTAETLSSQSRAWLERLPLEARLDGMLVTHGALGDPWRYVTTTRLAVDELDRLAEQAPDARTLIVGHTHRPLAVARFLHSESEHRGQTVSLDERARWLLNPGSVGQSRERRPLVRFMVVDLGAATAWFGATPYDVRHCRRTLRSRGLPVDACHPRSGSWSRRAPAALRALRAGLTLPGRRRDGPSG